jgi:hypothetical protein
VDKKKIPKLLEIIPALRRKWEEYSPPIALMSKLNGKCPARIEITSSDQHCLLIKCERLKRIKMSHKENTELRN